MEDFYFGSISNPIWVMANAALAGVINMIPGAQAASTDLQHDAYDAWAQAGIAPHHLDVVKNNAMAYGWW
ncbi:hypothetical protein K3888_07780 [Dietzia aurantiaca]|uniref:hypothetical protein n=1 Tax=Dietzia aurantiaca TaxID=983873 RepID=UPI001E2FEC9A|nr:hypothetical protein [Dietzia aurantiaca]MCD2262599.1 hypothetical protein [Dietzia aurantiaca]